MNPLKAWWQAATPEEKRRMAQLAGTSVESVHQMAGAYRTEGELRLTPEKARGLELASKKLARKGLPVLRREILAPACGQCEFAKKCRKGGAS